MKTHRSIWIFLIGFALSQFITPWAQLVMAQPPAAWTILIYLDADNNLERYAIDDFLEMAAIGSSEQVHIVVQFDRIPGYDDRYGNWSQTLRFRVEQGMTPTPANALMDIGEANMGDPQTLIDFARWGMARFPAQRTALVVWNHGDGWRTANLSKEGRKAICWDDTNGRDALDSAELRRALAAITADGSRPLDLLAFDACLMAMIEIDAQVRLFALTRTASEDYEPGAGYPYHTILADLQARPNWTGDELGIAIVERYAEAHPSETQSAVRLDHRYDALIAAVDELAGDLIAHLDVEIEAIRSARRQAQQFSSSYIDLHHLAELLAAADLSSSTSQAAQAVMEALSDVMLTERHSSARPGAHGISIYFPAVPNAWDSMYAGENDYLVFTAQTRWDEFLTAYLALSVSCDPDAFEPDNDMTTATPITLTAGITYTTTHNFCPAADAADWVRFEVVAGQTLRLTTSHLEYNCDTTLTLLDGDGTTVLAYNDDSGSSWASRIEWTAPRTGIYYARVQEYYGRSGVDTRYRLNIATLNPVVYGRVSLQGRTAANGVRIAASGYLTTTTITGDFALPVAGTISLITATHPGYLMNRWIISAPITSSLTLPPLTLWGGDMNQDGQIDILDIVFIAARFGSRDVEADLNADGVVDIGDLVLPAGNFGRAAF